MSRLCFKVLQIQKEVLTRRRDKRAGPVAQYKITEHALQNHILRISPIMSYKTTTNNFFSGIGETNFFKNRREKRCLEYLVWNRRKKIQIIPEEEMEYENIFFMKRREEK